MALPNKPKLKSLAQQGYVKPQVKKVVLNEPPTETSPYYVIPGGDYRKAWEVNTPDYRPATYLSAAFGNQPVHSEGWDKLSPMERGSSEFLGGNPTMQWMASGLEKLSSLPAVGWLFAQLQKPVQYVERAFGYAYQSIFDPTLRGPDSLGVTLFGKAADYLKSTNPNKQRMGAAWLASSAWAETTDIMGVGREKVLAGVYFASNLPKITAEVMKNSPAILAADFLGGKYPALPEYERVMGNIASPEFFKWYAETGTEQAVEQLDVDLVARLRDKGWAEKDIEKALEMARGGRIPPIIFKGIASEASLEDIPPDAWLSYLQATANMDRVWEDKFMRGQEMDSGGLPALIAIRQKIMAGVDYDTAYQEYMQSLGGLAYRAQMSDLSFQIVADPLNLVPMLRVKDWIHGMRSTILLARVAPEITNAAADVANAARVAANLVEAGDDVDQAVRAGRAVDAANGFIKAARSMQLDDFTKAADNVEALVKMGASAQDIAKAIEQVTPALDRLDEMKDMSRVERIFLAVTGGDPFNPNFGKIRIGGHEFVPLRSRLNPFALSAAGRADEFLNSVYHSVQIIMKEASNDPVEITAMLKRAASGIFGNRFGHVVISPIGRHVQTVLRKMDEHLSDALEMWMMTTKERSLASTIARAIGTDIVEVVEKGKSMPNASALFDRLVAASLKPVANDPALAELFAMVAKGDVKAETIFQLGKLFESTTAKIVPYTPELFRASVIRNMADTIVDMAKQSFGLREARWLEKAVVPVKAIESLVLLGLNPLYPIRNFFNNEVTMYMRGVSSMLLPRSMLRLVPGVGRTITSLEDVMDTFGIDVARLHEGFGIQGTDLLADLARGEARAEEFGVAAGREAIRKTVWGTPKGITGKIINSVRNIKDFRATASAFERLSSERAMTMGMVRAWGWIWPRTMTQLEDFRPGLASRLDEFADGYADMVTQAARAARKPEDLVELLTSKNIRLNLETVLSRTAEAMGISPEQVAKMIPEETIEAVRGMLKNLGVDATPQQIEEGFTFLRQTAQDHIDELVTSHMEDIAAEAVSKIESEGQVGIVQVWGELTDRTTRRHYAHMERLDDAWDRIYKIKDPTLRGRMVTRLMEESEQVWTRHWKYERALRDGMVKGLAARGKEVSASWLKAYDELNDANRTFYKLRNELWAHWWEGSESKSYDDLLLAQVGINETLDAEYLKLTDLTEAQHAKMDASLIDALFTDDSPMVDLTRMWRDTVRKLRRKYMDDVLEFRQSIRGLPDAQKQAAWVEFHAANRKAFMEIRGYERMGMDMLNGDATAADAFRMKQVYEGVEPGQVMEIQRKILQGGLVDNAGVTLTDADKGLRDYLIKAAPMSPERRRLQQIFGETFSQDIVDEYAKRWTGKGIIGPGGEVPTYSPHPTEWTLEGPAGGTQGAMWYRNEAGERFIVKASEDVNRVATESLSNLIYQRLGILAPETGRIRMGPFGQAGVWASSAREVKGTIVASIVNDPGLRAGFLADAYLGNWDVMGANFDNIVWDKAGKPWRVDQGGTMFYRAQGAPKEFGAEVTELDSLLDAAKNPNASMAYGAISEAEKREQAITLVMRMDDAWIKTAVDSAGFDTQTAKAVRQALIDRRNWLADKFDLKVPKPKKLVGLQPGGPQNIHEFIEKWVREDGTWKEQMVKFLEDNPGAAQEVQDLAQWWLYENGFSSMPLYTGKLRIYRGKPIELGSLQLRPYDSMTPRFDIGKKFAAGSPVLEFEVPAENILSHQNMHPGFDQYRHESEFILNGKGYEGARLVSVNGHPPTEAEVQALKVLNPDLEWGATLGEIGKPSIDFDNVVGRQRFDGLVEDDMLFEGTGVALDNMEQAAIRNLREPPTVLASLPEDLKVDLTHYLDRVTGDLNDARLASVRMAEGLRDSALLNYSGRYNYDNWLSVGMPFEFWWTHSMMQWAASTIDRPAWLAQFSRTRDFLMNAQTEHRGFPTRLRGRVRIPIPFAPKEMGDAWIDPFSAFGLPFEQFVQPFERWKTSTVSQEQRTVRKLEDMQRSGEISDAEFREATTTRSGSTWNQAQGLVLEADKGLQFDLLDFMNLSVSPHLPITLAANIARGRPEEIGVLPHTRTLRNVGILLGMDPGVYDNIWGNIRKAIGLPAFDQWEDYRVDRQFGNMLGDNKLTPQDAIRAMVEREGTVFNEARRQSAKTEATQWGYSLLGLPVNFYPPGEEHLREITSTFFEAMDQDGKGNPYPLRTFFDKFPEYEVRLALWKTPEERAKQFMADWIYDKYYGMPDINRREVRDALGDQFVDVMLAKETRNPQSASVNVLGMWMRMMGGDAPGEIATDALPIPLTRPDIANRLQVWYTYRDRIFPGVFDLQGDYFQLVKGEARSEFREIHPMLPIYWEQRKQFMYRNPDLAPYIEEDPTKLPQYPSEAELRQAEQAQPNYTWDEWTNLVSFPVGRLVLDYVDDGSPLPASVIDRLKQTAEILGLEGGWKEVLDRMTTVAPELTGQ